MISRKRKRLNLIVMGLILLVVATFLVGYGMRDGIEFFKSPSQVVADPQLIGKRFRLGGLVKSKSIEHLSDGAVSFVVDDGKKSINVYYKGILPSLFAENQGVIARGILMKIDSFVADEVLAKHDENYLPKEIIDTLKKQEIYVDPG